METWLESNSSSRKNEIFMRKSRDLRKWAHRCYFYFEHFRATQIELMMYSSKATQKWQGSDQQRCTSCRLGRDAEAGLGGCAEPLAADSEAKHTVAGDFYPPPPGKWQFACLFFLSVSQLGIYCSISVVKNLLYWSSPRGSMTDMSQMRVGNN